MRQLLIPFVAALVGGGVGAFAATHWLPGGRAGTGVATSESGAATDDLREQLRELRALLERPRELAAPPASVRASAGGPTSPSGATVVASDAAPATSPALEAAIEKAVAAGIEAARKKDPNAFSLTREDPQKKATLAEVARDLNLSSSQEDEIRRAYTESTDKFLKLLAEPESTPDAIRRELDEAKADSAKRSMLMLKYMPKMIGKLGEVMAVQSEREMRIHKALGAENVPKFEKYKVAEEDPFGMDGGDLDISATINDK